jgi:type III pantothenate kinase
LSASEVLLLDIGNSGGKWVLIHQSGECRHGRASLDVLVEDLGVQLSGATALIASVAAPAQEQALSAELEAFGCSVWYAQSRGSQGGLINAYAEPERMGVDRWLTMLAARRRCKGAFCVVDAGSALTIDLVDECGEHKGGYIIPGAALMERALFADTQRVRYDALLVPTLAPGRSTAEAVGNGILLAQAGAVRLALMEARERGLCPDVFLCGGGAASLRSTLGSASTLVPDLVFEGLLYQAEMENPQMLNFLTLAEALGSSSD